MQIRTRWHKIVPAIEQDELYLTAIPNQNVTHYSNYQINRETFVEWLGDLEELPKFVIEPDLLEIAVNGGYQKSLFDMKKAGVLRMPFPQMLVELADEAGQAVFVLLQDLGQMPEEVEADHGLRGFDFRGWTVRLLRDVDGDYVVFAPALMLLSIEKGDDGEPWLKVSGTAMGLLPDETRINHLVEQTFKKDLGAFYHGVLSGVLLMATRGVGKESINPTKLNKKRKASGERPIPEHTYIYIGRVYRSSKGDASDAYVPGRTVRPHWRRAHLARWRTGPRKADDRGWGEKFVEARIVALANDADPSSVRPPTYVVRK
jgi:hypothetical protein